MEYFSIGWGCMYEGTIWWLGRIYLKLHLGWWLLVGQTEGFRNIGVTSIGDNENSGIGMWWGLIRSRIIWENFQVSETRVNPKTNKWNKNSLEPERVFQAGEKHY